MLAKCILAGLMASATLAAQLTQVSNYNNNATSKAQM